MAAKAGTGTKGVFDVGQNAEINVTPFVDVLLVLLIIFMLAIPLATVSIKLDLPPILPGDPPLRPPVIVDVGLYGRVYLSGREVSLAALDDEVAKALASPDPLHEQISLRAEARVPYRDFLGVLNILQQGGYGKISLVTEKL